MDSSPLLRLLLAAAGLACLVHGILGLRSGTIRLKGVTGDRDGSPMTFWASILVILAFGAMLLWFALFGRFAA